MLCFAFGITIFVSFLLIDFNYRVKLLITIFEELCVYRLTTNVKGLERTPIRHFLRQNRFCYNGIHKDTKVMLKTYEPPRGKTNNVVSEQVRHKPACTSTEKSYNLEISDLSRRGIVLSE